MVRHTVQVLEDKNTNLVHLINEFNSSHPSDVHAFVQTADGVRPLSSGRQYIHGHLTHKYTGSFNGDKQMYARNLQHFGNASISNETLLRRSGVNNLRRGHGMVISAVRFASIGTRAFSVYQVWNDCIADGVVTAGEFARLGLAVGGIRLPDSIFDGGYREPSFESYSGNGLQFSTEQPSVEPVDVAADSAGSFFETVSDLASMFFC